MWSEKKYQEVCKVEKVFYLVSNVFTKHLSTCINQLTLHLVSRCSGSSQLCSYDVAYYSLKTALDGYSELQASVQKETKYDAFCIHSQNRKSSKVSEHKVLDTQCAT